jgi:hypothetical protein
MQMSQKKNNSDSRKGKKEGGRKEGRRTGNKKQRPSSKMLRAPSNLHMLLSNGCKFCAIFGFWFPNVVSTVQFIDFSGARSKHHASMCNVQIVIPTYCKYQSTCSFELQKAAK